MALKNPFSKKDRKPRKPPQMWVLFKATRKAEPAVVWWMLGAALAAMAVVVVLGYFFNFLPFSILLGLPFAFLAALIVLGRRAEALMYRQMDGQPGAVGAALQMVRRGGWTIDEQPIALDPRTKDAVYRGYGRRGVMLVGEGPAGRITKMLNKEKSRTERLLPGVPLHILQVGKGDAQIPLKKLPRQVMKLKGRLTVAEVDVVGKRLRSMGGLKPPVPKGMDPNRARPDRRAMRGR